MDHANDPLDAIQAIRSWFARDVRKSAINNKPAKWLVANPKYLSWSSRWISKKTQKKYPPIRSAAIDWRDRTGRRIEDRHRECHGISGEIITSKFAVRAYWTTVGRLSPPFSSPLRSQEYVIKAQKTMTLRSWKFDFLYSTPLDSSLLAKNYMDTCYLSYLTYLTYRRFFARIPAGCSVVVFVTKHTWALCLRR